MDAFLLKLANNIEKNLLFLWILCTIIGQNVEEIV